MDEKLHSEACLVTGGGQSMLHKKTAELKLGERIDLWVAAVAGPLPWFSGPATAGDRSIGVLGLLTGLFGVLLTAQQALSESGSAVLERWSLVAFAIFWIAFSAPTIFWALGFTSKRIPRFVLYCGVRAVLLLLALVAWTTLGSAATPLSAAALGAAVGFELAVTERSLGIEVENDENLLLRLRSFVLSTPHLLIVAFLILLSIFNKNQRGLTIVAIRTLLLLDVGTMAAIASSILGKYIFRWNDSDIANVTQQVRFAEFERRGHWLHDDVLGKITTIRQRVADEGLAGQNLIDSLVSADHELRKIQLDQGLETGRRKVSHVLQPYIRHAQDQRLNVIDVPSSEVGDLLLTKETGEILKRCIAGAVNNAIKARSQRLWIRVTADPQYLKLTVEDDGGGGACIVAGRGLYDLQQDLNGKLNLVETADGTIFEATIRL